MFEEFIADPMLLVKFLTVIGMLAVIGYFGITQISKIIFPSIILYDDRSNKIEFARKFWTIREKKNKPDRKNATKPKISMKWGGFIAKFIKKCKKKSRVTDLMLIGMGAFDFGLIHDHLWHIGINIGSPGYGPIDQFIILMGFIGFIGGFISLMHKEIIEIFKISLRNKIGFGSNNVTKERKKLIGYWIKTSLFPLMHFDRFMIKDIRIERKFQKILIYTNNIEYNEKKRYFEAIETFKEAKFEDAHKYEGIINETIGLIGKDVADAIIGDPNLRKKKFEEAIPNPRGKADGK